MSTYIFAVLIMAISRSFAFEFEFVADLSCTSAHGQPSGDNEGDVSSVTCPVDYSMTNCGYSSHGIWSQNGNVQNIIQANRAKPDGSIIQNDVCIAQNGQSITGSWVRAQAICCKFNDQKLINNVVFSASLTCNQYTSPESQLTQDSIAISQCALPDEYLFGCTGISESNDLKAFCPGDQDCSEITDGNLDYIKFQSSNVYQRLNGYTILDNKGSNGQCAAVKGSTTASDGVYSQATCCQISGYDEQNFIFKGVECTTSFVYESMRGGDDEGWLGCYNDDYTITSCHSNEMSYDNPVLASYRSGGPACFADNIYYGTTAEVSGLCCKATFAQIV